MGNSHGAGDRSDTTECAARDAGELFPAVTQQPDSKDRRAGNGGAVRRSDSGTRLHGAPFTRAYFRNRAHAAGRDFSLVPFDWDVRGDQEPKPAARAIRGRSNRLAARRAEIKG